MRVSNSPRKCCSKNIHLKNFISSISNSGWLENQTFFILKLYVVISLLIYQNDFITSQDIKEKVRGFRLSADQIFDLQIVEYQSL